MTWSNLSAKPLAKRDAIETEIQELLDGLQSEEIVSYKFYENIEVQINELVKE